MKRYGFNFKSLYDLPLNLLYDLCQFIHSNDIAITPDKDVLIRGCIIPFLRDTAKGPKGANKDAIMRVALITTGKLVGVTFENWETSSTDAIATVVRRHIQTRIAEKLDSLSPEEKKKILGIARNSLKESAKIMGIPLAGAGAVAAGELSGFGIYLATTTGLKALSLALGTTFSWSTYQGAATLLGVIFGPVGWTIAGLSLTTSIAVATHNWLKGKKERKLALVVITLILAIGENPFEFFDLPPAASFEDVKKRYRAMMKTFHPDKLEGNLPEWVYDEFSEKLFRCQEAYLKLKIIYRQDGEN